MKLLADENIPSASILVLRDAGHDVLSVSQVSPGVSDLAVMRLAIEQERIILTFDRDFGTLAFHERVDCPLGLVLLRFRPSSPDEPGTLVASLLRAGDVDLLGQFTALDRERIRQRPLPRV